MWLPALAAAEPVETVSLSATSATRAVAASAPVIEQPADMRVDAGATADQIIHASDVDGDPLVFSYNGGPNYMTVTTTDPGTGSATGAIHLAPSLYEAGPATGIVGVYDGVNYRIASFGISVFPLLSPVADMTVDEGATADQVLAVAGNGRPLTFGLVGGPPFVTVTATSDTTLQIHVAPGSTDSGHYSAYLSVSDGVGTLRDYFEITVNNVNRPPVLSQPYDMHASAGAITEQVITASDADHDPVIFSVSGGPYLRAATLSSYPGIGVVDVSPPAGEVTGFEATARATDGISTGEQSFFVLIDGENQPPVIHSSPIDTDEGTDVEFSVIATDTEGQRLMATLSNLPAFMTPGLVSQRPGGDTLTVPIRLQYPVAGVYHPVLSVSDQATTTTDTLDITIRSAGLSETSLRLDGTSLSGPLEREYSDLDGTFEVTSSRFIFLSTTGSGAAWTVRFPWAEGDYVVDGLSSRGFGIFGQDTTGIDFWDCSTYPQIYHVRRVTHRLDGTISSLWATFQMGCGLSGEIRYHVKDIPIVLTAPHWLATNTNQALLFHVFAADTAGDQVAITASGLPAGAAFLDLGGGVGNFLWTPTRLQFGDFQVRFVATSHGGLSDTTFTRLYVTSHDLPPQARCGGPYTGTVGVPLPFSSSGSGDPDGDPLSYRWTFGDGGTASEAFPQHTYARMGPYPVSLVVSDGILAAGDQTLATIQERDSTRAFAVQATTHPIHLEAGGGHFCVALELVDAPARVVEIDPSSVRMEVKGLGSTDIIPADPTSRVLGDANRNGIPDLTMCFGSETLRALFGGVTGTVHALTTIAFALQDGHGFRASLPVDVIGPSGLRPLTAPNPLRQSGVFSFVTSVEGRARLALFDSHGRRVRTILDVSSLPTGYHDIPIDTRDAEERPLPSGTYYYRLETKEGTRTGSLTLLR